MASVAVDVSGIFLINSFLEGEGGCSVKEKLCGNGDSILMGKCWLSNNLWGAQTGSGSQCVWNTSIRGSNIAWGTSWNWSGRADSIKSYVSMVLGWHWGWKLPDTGLPVQLSANRNIHTSWEFNLDQLTPGGMNVSYDIWLSTNARLGNANPSDEIMIWLYKSGDINPIGSKKTITTIGGDSWELWEGSHPTSGWSVHSFVRTENINSQILNLKNFFTYLISHGLSSSSYLISIEAGTEIFTGAGRLDTTSYSVDIGETTPTVQP
jgi:xyloglucan-specific endo-beta-1,4-glucanase